MPFRSLLVPARDNLRSYRFPRLRTFPIFSICFQTAPCPPCQFSYVQSALTLRARTDGVAVVTILKRIAVSAAEALAGSVLIALNLRWIAQARRTLRKWRAAA